MFFPSLSFLVPMIQNDDQCLILPKSVCRRPAGTRTMHGCGCPWRSTTRTPTRPTQTPTVLNAPTAPLDGAMFVACTPHLPQIWHTVDRVDRFDRSYWSLNIKKKQHSRMYIRTNPTINNCTRLSLHSLVGRYRVQPTSIRQTDATHL
jgi:hypothetical protein